MTVRRVGVVGLGEAGNFGDDLILIAISQAITSALTDSEISFTGYGYRLDWPSISTQLGTDLSPHAKRSSRDLPGSQQDARLFSDCDVVLFGGGGLFETSHHPYRPYHWLRYLPRTKPLIPVLAVGIGIGPLTRKWQAKLRSLGSPFTDCYLRDAESIEYARTRLGWEAQRCHDFVDAAFLRQFGLVHSSQHDNTARRLGVAVRAWPGLGPSTLAAHIDNVATREDVDSINFYVLEAPGDRGPDVPFTEAVMAHLRHRRTTLRKYRGAEIVDFIRDMNACSVAISMKLHSSAVWGAADVPMYPIFYAPKTASMFGKPYRGLEVLDTKLRPIADDPSVPPSRRVVYDWLNAIDEGHVGRSRTTLNSVGSLKYQGLSLAWNVKQRASQAISSPSS
ncbi:polysaccharide pyruvyl transferase family protein [Nucisporomicrobium flavum]|uniref:polysaccharide pyruvyl transferase family protein n=1 Tax=Nucisporomicrobium flavum TaxID=2785915 RepID=UPI0018F4B8AD